MPSYEEIFSRENLEQIFPPERTAQFFEALFGDPEEGAYDIRMSLLTSSDRKLDFLFELHQRGDACLACNLTYGLPGVFLRHPIINIQEGRMGRWYVGVESWHDGRDIQGPARHSSVSEEDRRVKHRAP